MARTWGQVLSGEGLKKFNAFFRNVNTINLKIFLTHGGIYKFERKFNKHSGERVKALRSL